MQQTGQDTMDADRRMLERVYTLFRNPNASPTQRVALIDEVEQYLSWRGGDGNEPRSGAPLAPTMFGPQSPDIRVTATQKVAIVELAKRVADGQPTALAKSTFEEVGKFLAESDRRPGESIEKARARFHQTPEGRLLRDAAKAAGRAETIALRETPVGAGPAMQALRKRADEIAAADRVTREKAIAKLANGHDPLFAAAQVEERGRAVA